MPNKIALVTGAGTGVGKAAVKALLDAGFDVALAGRRLGVLQEAAATLDADGRRTACFAADVGRAEDVAALFAGVAERFGRLDVLFNNAGMGAPAIPLDELTLAQWQAVVDVNLTGVFLCTQHAFKIMKSQSPKAAASSTTAPSRRMSRGRSPRPIPPPSMRSPA